MDALRMSPTYTNNSIISQASTKYHTIHRYTVKAIMLFLSLHVRVFVAVHFTHKTKLQHFLFFVVDGSRIKNGINLYCIYLTLFFSITNLYNLSQVLGTDILILGGGGGGG